MTARELLEYLEGLDEDQLEKEIRLAMQPAWAFEYSIGDYPVETDDVIYLSEGSQLGYLPGEVSEELGWR